jgi:hypothetical protein
MIPKEENTMKIRTSLTIMAILFGFGPAAEAAKPQPQISGSGFSNGEKIPAALCQQAGESQSLDYYHGRVRNWTPFNKRVDCPVLTGTASYDEMMAAVIVVDRNTERDVSCTLYTYFETGSVSYRWSSDRSSGASDTPQGLYMGELSAAGASLIGCTLPGLNYNNLYNANATMSEILYYRARTK